MDYHLALEALSDAVVVTSAADRIVYANPAVERLLGWSSAELLGRTLATLVPARLQSANLQGFRQWVEMAAPRRGERAVRIPALHKSGAEVQVELALSSFEIDGDGTYLVGTLRDVSDRTELEASLARERSARARFQDFVDGIDHAILWELDATTMSITFISAKAEPLLGYPLDTWYAKSEAWLDRIHPEDRDRVLQSIVSVVRNDSDIGIEHRFLCADGSVMWVHTGARLAQRGPGAALVIHALSANVTHLKQAEARAAAVSNQLKTILRGVSEGITAQTVDGQLVYANDVGARMCGFSSAREMLSASVDEITASFEILDVDGKELPLEHLPSRVAAKTGKPHEATVRFRQRGTDEDRWSVVSATPIKAANGKVERIINVFRDLTETKRAEHGLRFLAEASAVLASSLDYEQTLRNVANLAVPKIADWCAIHLKSPDDESLTALVVSHGDPEKRAWAEDLNTRYPPQRESPHGVHHVMSSGVAALYPDVSDELLHAAAQDEEHLRILKAVGMKSVMLVPLKVGGVSLGVITFVAAESGRRFDDSDFSLARALADRAATAMDNARAYAEAEQARATAEEASRLKDEFLATVSHELRTPLSAILGWATLLRTERRQDLVSVQQAADVIERNARSQLRIIEDILDVSRIIRGELRVDTEPVDLRALIRQTFDSLKPAADAKQIRLSLSESDEPALLMGDPERLRQIFWNLVSNAVKFTPEGGSVWASVARDSGRLVVVIRDTGCGIDTAVLPFVFDRFRQGDSSASRLFAGLGLGLAIVRHLVELHGGTVTAASEGVGKGSTFTVSLPVKPFTTAARSLTPPGGTLMARNRAPSAHARPLSGLRLLVVEDDPDSRDLIEILLSAEGASVRAAATAEEALDAVSEFEPDILISDIGMRGFDGFWLMKQVRQRFPKLPAVALTAFASREDARRARSVGFDVHVGKPVDPAELVQTLVDLRPPA